MSRKSLGTDTGRTGALRVAWVSACLCITLWSGTVGAKSIEEAVQTALFTNPRVTGAAAASRAAKYDVREARGGYFPSLNLTGNVGKERADIDALRATGSDRLTLTHRESSLTLTQMLFDGLGTRNEIARRAALVEAAWGRLEDTRESVAFRTTQVYLDVLRSRRLLTLGEENVASHREILGKVRRRVERGVGQKADLQQAVARLALAQSTVTRRRGDLEQAIANYERVVGELPDGLLRPASTSTGIVRSGEVDSEQLMESIADATETGYAQHPALNAAQAQVEAAKAAADGAKAAYLPRVDLELGATRDKNIAGVKGDRRIETVFLVGRWNLFRGGSDKARERALAERRVEAMDAAADTRRAIKEGVTVALQSKVTSEQRLIYLKQHVAASEETLRSYQSQFELGRRTLLDVLNAKNELFAARSNLTSGIYEDLINQYFVEASKGLLVQSLGIALSEAESR
jgi:outer membrane protein, adhesin transport system